MPVVTDTLISDHNVTVRVTYNTNNPDNIQRAECTNSNPFNVVLLVGVRSTPVPIRLLIPANSTQGMNPTAAQSADLATLSVDVTQPPVV